MPEAADFERAVRKPRLRTFMCRHTRGLKTRKSAFLLSFKIQKPS